MTLEPLEVGAYRDFVRRSLAEDLGWGDTAAQAVVAPEARAAGTLVMHTAGVLAGLQVALEAFRQLDPAITVASDRRDGDRCQPGDRLAVVTGLAAPLLTAERTALNILRHLSGIATLTRRFVDAGDGRITIADTRKTLPLLRALQKYAVRAGGGENGRFALDEGLILKANHIRVAGGVEAAVRQARRKSLDTPVQVEVSTWADADEALAAGAGVLVWTGPSLDDLAATIRHCRGRARVEVSGTIDVNRIPDLVSAGADFVSIGALTDSAPAADISFELRSI